MPTRPQLLGLSLALLALVASCYGASPFYDDVAFSQLEVRRWVAPGWPPIADWTPRPFDGEIYQTATDESSGHVWILTSTSLILMDPRQNNTVLYSTSASLYTGMAIAGSNLLLTSPTQLLPCKLVRFRPHSEPFSCESVIPLSDPMAIKYATILKNGTIILAADRLYSIDPRDQTPRAILGAYTYTAIAYHSDSDTLAVGTDRLLWIYSQFNKAPTSFWRYFRVDGIIDSAITCLAYSKPGTLYIGNALALNVMNTDFTFQRFGGGPGGLPYGNITSIGTSYAENGLTMVWIGTKSGMVLLDGGKFRYLNGPRYMPDIAFGPGNSAKFVSAGDSGSALVTTESGAIVVFYFETMSLQAKANAFQALVHPYHGRFGLVSASNLAKFGDMKSYVLQDSENDGLWTSMYLASQALRFATTKDNDAKIEANYAMQGLVLLNNVTGIKGLFARSVLKQTKNAAFSNLPWYQSKTMPGWTWQGDTSSDEVTGHIFAYTMYYEYVATTPEEKELAATLLTNTMSYIVKNDFYLIGVDGKPTTWGIWNPKYINDNPDWFDQRGLNSVQIMCWLAAAESIAQRSGKPSQIYTDAIKTLKTVHQYDLNIINAKIPIPTDDNYSDDELQHLPLLTYIVSKSTSLDDTFYISCDRTFNIVKDVQSPLWNLIYVASLLSRPKTSTPITIPDQDFNDGFKTLRQWPMSWVDWPIDNTQRLDILVSQYPNRRGRRDLVNLLPRDEIAFYRWNADPFEYHQGGNGLSLAEPTAYLLPYWLGRFLGVLSADRQ